ASGPHAADLRPRLDAVGRMRPGRGGSGRAADDERADRAAAARIWAEADRIRRLLGIEGGGAVDSDSCGLLLAMAFPDRIAQRREDGRYLLSGGRGAAFSQPQTISEAAYLVAAELDDAGTDSRIKLAAPVRLKELETAMAETIEERSVVEWDDAAGAVRARRRKRLGAIVLGDVPEPKPDASAISRALLAGVRSAGIGMLPWTDAARRLQKRVLFMRMHEPEAEPEWPDLSDEALSASMERWLLPFVQGMRSRGDLQKLPLASALDSLLTWEQKRRLDEEAPSHIVVPSGSRIPVDYGDPAAPSLAVKLQELFGMTRTPLACNGRVPITMHLLSPAMRPVQVTRDLASFWRHTYFEVKKDLKGRYPKHYWPDDPLTAAPTNRAKPRT
ncbi:ATP-dependent helicase C-terminal domain-containing protein, partial [Paenibacillus sp. GYB003]|uniref:ATP-dependent helicase C-terminal domain-containing protein n=1 Tax=Paenibacillus sp. GYB003 TaxID=2994392 RepID=UPI002F967A71